MARVQRRRHLIRGVVIFLAVGTSVISTGAEAQPTAPVTPVGSYRFFMRRFLHPARTQETSAYCSEEKKGEAIKCAITYAEDGQVVHLTQVPLDELTRILKPLVQFSEEPSEPDTGARTLFTWALQWKNRKLSGSSPSVGADDRPLNEILLLIEAQLMIRMYSARTP